MELFTEVIDDGATLRIKTAAGYDNVPKSLVAVEVNDTDPNVVVIEVTDGDSFYNTFNLITNPVAASADALRNLIQAMLDTAPAGGGLTDAQLRASPVPVTGTFSLPSGAQVFTSSSVAVNGSVAAGATSVLFSTSSDYAGTINGVARVADNSYPIEAVTGNTLPAIDYTFSAGSMIIDKLV